MKKLCLSLMALGLTAALITGCSKNNASSPVPATTTTSNESAAPVVQQKAVADVDGVMIAGWYYSLSTNADNEEVMVGEYEANVGSKVKLYSDPESALKVVAKWDVKLDGGATRDFVKIYSPDYERDFWVRDYAVVPFAKTGTVLDENVFLYTKADLGSIGNRVVEPYTLFAVFDDAPEGDSDNRFYKIRYYINDGETYTVNGYLLKHSVKTDVPTGMIQYGARLEALKAAEAEKPGSVDSFVLDELDKIYTTYLEDFKANY